MPIVDVIFNDDPASKYDYKYFTLVYESGRTRKFYYHKNNPIPTKEEMVGKDLFEIRELYTALFYKAVGKVG